MQSHYTVRKFEYVNKLSGFFFRKLEIRKWFKAQIFKSVSPAYNAGKGFCADLLAQ